ncbi:MAG: hypothetical protein NZ528_10335, partial [Caldilineales bacterium]|nr:hypothetical protein [Caldilineales bacterium]
FAWMEGRQLDGAEPLRWGLTEMIAAAVRVKVAIVEEDPLEQGRRAVLNLGHTFGHALEALSNYRMRHGEAVAVGLAAATRLAARLHVCEAELVDRVERLLERLALPTRIEAGYAPEQVLAAMATDKKRLSGRLRFVLPRAIGDVDIFDDVPAEAVLAVLGELSGQDQQP